MFHGLINIHNFHQHWGDLCYYVLQKQTNKQTNKEFTMMIYQKWSEIKLLMHGFVSLSIQLIITSKLGNQYMQRVLVTSGMS